jgi:hypothetical protein
METTICTYIHSTYSTGNLVKYIFLFSPQLEVFIAFLSLSLEVNRGAFSPAKAKRRLQTMGEADTFIV